MTSYLQNKIQIRFLSSIIYGFSFLYINSLNILIPFFIALSILMIGSIYEIIKINKKFKNKFIIFLECIYLIISFILLINIRQHENGLVLIYILLLHVWASDIGGYVIGSLGKHQLTKISKKKTWEGLLGSLFFCILTGFFLKTKINENIEINSFILSIIICLSSVTGDLIISKIKRINNIKQSGIFLPGHGGFLDRLDSLLFATLIYYLMIYI